MIGTITKCSNNSSCRYQRIKDFFARGYHRIKSIGITKDSFDKTVDLDNVFLNPNYMKILKEITYNKKEDIKNLLKLKELGLPFSKEELQDVMVYSSQNLKLLTKDDIKLLKELKIVSKRFVLDSAGYLFAHLSKSDKKYLLSQKNEFFKLLSKESDLLINKNNGDRCAEKNYYTLAIKQVLCRRLSNPFGNNPLLKLTKNIEEQKELENLIDVMALRMKAYQYGSGDWSDRIQNANIFGKEINTFLQSKKIIPEDYNFVVEQLKPSALCGEGIAFKVGIVNLKGENYIEPLCMKVMGAPRKEYSISKYIRDNTKLSNEELAIGEVYGGNDYSGYTLAKFLKGEDCHDVSEIMNKELERLGLFYFDKERSGNIIGGKIADFGGFVLDKKNPIYSEWIKINE